MALLSLLLFCMIFFLLRWSSSVFDDLHLALASNLRLFYFYIGVYSVPRLICIRLDLRLLWYRWIRLGMKICHGTWQQVFWCSSTPSPPSLHSLIFLRLFLANVALRDFRIVNPALVDGSFDYSIRGWFSDSSDLLFRSFVRLSLRSRSWRSWGPFLDSWWFDGYACACGDGEGTFYLGPDLIFCISFPLLRAKTKQWRFGIVPPISISILLYQFHDLARCSRILIWLYISGATVTMSA